MHEGMTAIQLFVAFFFVALFGIGVGFFLAWFCHGCKKNEEQKNDKDRLL